MSYLKRKVMNIIESNKRVLDIGCHTGFLSERLKENSCKVTGVEINREAALLAKQYCEEIIIGDIEEEGTFEKINGRFDVILLLDILEHLLEPWALLSKLKYKLKRNGYVLICIPNIACLHVRLQLLLGRFNYEDRGVLDRAHLRYFTYRSMLDLINNTGYEVKEYYVHSSYFSSKSWGKRAPYLYRRISHFSRIMYRKFPNLFGMQILFKIIPKC